MNEQRWKGLWRLWPFLALAGLAAVFVLLLLFSRKAPFITTIEPAMAAPGQTVVLVGGYFGRTKREGTLSLAGEIPPPSLIQSWSDQRIEFIVPQDVTSGLVTVSNSQGSSPGVLFTNTDSVPTVLQAAGRSGVPLIFGISPPQPTSGQLVTLLGRGLGSGSERVLLRLTDGAAGPTFELEPLQSLLWNDRAVKFYWPAGLGPGTTVQALSPRGESSALPWPGTSPLSFGAPRTIEVQFLAVVTVPNQVSVTVWGPVPQRLSGTNWTLISSEPAPVAGTRPLAFRWPSGSAGDRKATYRLSLTSFERRWDGWSAGTVPAADAVPASDPRVREWWRTSAAALKTLSAKWGLETSDPWLRIQRVHQGLTAAFQMVAGEPGQPVLSREPAAILASKQLDSLEAASVGVYLASQSGVPGRLVSGLWLSPDDRIQTRYWAEVWLAGAGWIPWDPADSPPGSLDSRHFPFDLAPSAPPRWEPQSTTLEPGAPGTLNAVSGEISGAGREAVVRWEITRTGK